MLWRASLQQRRPDFEFEPQEAPKHCLLLVSDGLPGARLGKLILANIWIKLARPFLSVAWPYYCLVGEARGHPRGVKKSRGGVQSRRFVCTGSADSDWKRLDYDEAVGSDRESSVAVTGALVSWHFLLTAVAKNRGIFRTEREKGGEERERESQANTQPRRAQASTHTHPRVKWERNLLLSARQTTLRTSREFFRLRFVSFLPNAFVKKGL